MNKFPNYGLLAFAVALVVVGALWVGLPAGTLAVLAVVVCALMMMFTKRGMHAEYCTGGGAGHDRPADRENPRDSASRR